MDENEQTYQNLIKRLTNSIENSIPSEFLGEELISNYLDINENNYFHYLAKYSFTEYCSDNDISSKEEIINKDKYKILLNEYLKKIELFVNILINIGCKIEFQNIFDQSPLEICLVKKNYYLAIEYLKCINNIDFLFNNCILNLIFNDNCIRDECINFLINIFKFDNNKNAPDVISKYLNKKLSNTDNISPFISIIKQYNNNIYEKFNEIIKENCVEYLQKKDKYEYKIISDEKTKNEIIEKSKLELYDFEKKFNVLINTLIKNKAEFNYIEYYTSEKGISAFMYLMAYPYEINLFDFMIKNDIQINYQDYLGRTALYHLINNKKNIIQINENNYHNAFNTLINNKAIDLSKRDINGISPFLLCLINDYYDDAKNIYDNHLGEYLSEFNLDILLFFIHKININKFNNNLILKIKNKFKNDINFDTIDNINDRTLLHYYFMFNYDNNDNYIDYIDNLIKIINLANGKNKKDIFNRNCLFYLFIDFCGDPKKGKDPYKILEYCLKNKLFEISLNDKDIFGNNLLIYAIKCGFRKSTEILIQYESAFDDSINKEGNNIYSMALMSDEDLFFDLYNKKNINIDPLQKIYIFKSNFEYFIELQNNINFQDKRKIDMSDFLNMPELVLKEGKILENEIFEKGKNLISSNKNEKEKNNNEFNSFYLLKEEQKNIINNYIKENLNFKFEDPLKEITLKIENKNLLEVKLILENPSEFIETINKNKKYISSEKLFSYAIKNNKNEFINKFRKDINIIDLNMIYAELKMFDDLINNSNKIIDENKEENKFINIKNKNDQNIIHILAMVQEQNNKELIKIYDKIKNIKIDDLFDSYGNTPIYYACQNYNKKFIEIFSNYIFNNKKCEEVNTQIFLVSNNNNTPLEELYKKINSEDSDLLNLIIEITIKEKIGYMKYILDYLIGKYKMNNKKDYFNFQYKSNISNSNYLIRIIGIYQFLVTELNYNILIDDENGNDPFMKCVIKNNYDFMFDVLFDDKYKKLISIDKTNNKGKSLIHLLLESNILNKNLMLLQMLKEGFIFNIKDNKGLCPIDYAFFSKDNEIFDILKNQYLKKELPLKIHLLYDFYKDSDLLYNESIQNLSKSNIGDKLVNLVYNEYQNDSNNIYKVCIDEEEIPYNITILKWNTNDNINLCDKYLLQIIENIKTKKFIVIFLDKNLINEYDYYNLKDAKNKFNEIFKERTNNIWDVAKLDKFNFKADNPDYYYYFGYDYSQELKIYEYLITKINNDSQIKMKIKYNENDNIKNLIYYLARKAFNDKLYNSDNNTKGEIFKKYKNKGIEEAIYILNQLEKIIINEEYYEAQKKEKAYLINCYLRLIPYSIHKNNDYTFESINELNEEKEKITSFYYIENIFKIFLGAIKNLDEIHPLDYIINSLGCHLIELKENTYEKECIKKYLKNTGANNIKNIFKITESINDTYFNPNNFHKRYIFFHGTKAENILSILSEGLKCSPVKPKFTDKFYGNGIYLSNSYDVSVKYTTDNLGYNDNMEKKDKIAKEKTFILLVEAALGEINSDYELHGLSILDIDFYTTKEGYRIILVDALPIKDTIIVVKDEMNVRVKYIVEIE